MCHDQIGYMLLQLGEKAKAILAHRRACDVYRILVAADPKDLQWRRRLGHGLGNLANTISMGGNKEETRLAYRLAQVEQETLLRLDPANGGYRSDLAMTLNNMSLVSERAESVELLRQALDLRRAFVAEKPDESYLKRNVARTLMNLASSYSDIGRTAEGLPLIIESCTTLDLLSSKEPNFMGLRENAPRPTSRWRRRSTSSVEMKRPFRTCAKGSTR